MKRLLPVLGGLAIILVVPALIISVIAAFFEIPDAILGKNRPRHGMRR